METQRPHIHDTNFGRTRYARCPTGVMPERREYVDLEDTGPVSRLRRASSAHPALLRARLAAELKIHVDLQLTELLARKSQSHNNRPVTLRGPGLSPQVLTA